MNTAHSYIVRPGSENMLAAELVCFAEKPPCGVCNDCRKVQKGIHPDVITIDVPGGKNIISVDQVREAVRSAYQIPNEGQRVVAIIQSAELMNTQAQNALLKILEDPPGHFSMILVTEKPGMLLDTVRSRCRQQTGQTTKQTGLNSVIEDFAESFCDAVAKSFSEQNETELTLFALKFPESTLGKNSDIPLPIEQIKKHITERFVKTEPQLAVNISYILNELTEYREHNVSRSNMMSYLCAKSAEYLFAQSSI